MKKKSGRYDINRPRPRYGHKYIQCKLCVSITFACFKQHLSNILNLPQKS